MDSTYLVHHGIKGMRWGVRRYQNPDGSLTPEGLLRYRNKQESKEYELRKYAYKLGGQKTSIGRYLGKRAEESYDNYRKAGEEYSKIESKNVHNVTDEMISNFAKANGISKEAAKRRAEYAMEDYRKAEKSDVIKKYPHDFAAYGHPIQAGGYASEKLMMDIEAKSGSWYFGEAVSPGFKKAYSEFKKIRDSSNKEKSFDEIRAKHLKANNILLDAVLKDLGFPITQANRDAISSSVFWD